MSRQVKWTTSNPACLSLASRRSCSIARRGSAYLTEPSASAIVRCSSHRKSHRPISSPSAEPTHTCKPGAGSPSSEKATRDIDSSGDSERPSANSITCRARRTPGQRAQAANTDASSPGRTFLQRNAESATTTPSRNGSSRARSTTVLAAVVTGTPLTTVTCCAGKAAECGSVPVRRARDPVPGRCVIVTTLPGHSSRSIPWMTAALWWLATQPGPLLASAAAARTRCSRMEFALAMRARAGLAYTPEPRGTSTPRRTSVSMRPRDSPAACSCAVVTTAAGRDTRGGSRLPMVAMLDPGTDFVPDTHTKCRGCTRFAGSTAGTKPPRTCRNAARERLPGRLAAERREPSASCPVPRSHLNLSGPARMAWWYRNC
jgi:hypothetical protein